MCLISPLISLFISPMNQVLFSVYRPRQVLVTERPAYVWDQAYKLFSAVDLYLLRITRCVLLRL